MANGFSFTLPTPNNLSEVIFMMKNDIKNNGGEFDGDVKSGTFTVVYGVTIKGKYTVNGDVVNVDITDRPIVATQNKIITKVKEYFGIKK
ncbi:MAG: hypothetical protein FWH57_07365 [Oscillospiraceae bacterium]|nr:hypothetical protein [Oscillospiraceae bacterium]